MKHPGCRVEYIHARNADIHRAFCDLMRRAPKMEADDFFQLLASQPASRFWVSEERATEVVSIILKGGELPPMRPPKMRMFQEIARRSAEIIKAEHPLKRPLMDIVFDVVNSPAPEFYLNPWTIRKYLTQYRARQ